MPMIALALAFIVGLFFFSTLHAHKANHPLALAPDRQPESLKLSTESAGAYSSTHQIFLPLLSHPYELFLPVFHYGNTAPQVYGPFPANDAARQSLNAYLAWSHTGDA